MPRRPVKAKRRAEAIALAREVGAAEAARRLGLSASTVRSWLRRAGVSAGSTARPSPEPMAVPATVMQAAVAESVPTDPVQAAVYRAAQAWKASTDALERMNAANLAGDTTAGRNLATSYGIATERAEKLERLATELRTSRPQATEALLDEMLVRVRGLLLEAGLSEREPRIAALLSRWFTGPAPSVAVPPAEPRPAQPRRGAVAPHRALPRPPADTASEPIDADDAEPVEPTEADDDTAPDDNDLADTSDDASEPDVDDAPPVEQVPLSAVPMAWRNRFQLGEAGQERARVAYSESLARQRQDGLAREAAAEQAAEQEAAERAAARAANPPPPLPVGWDRAGGRRGPAGRAGW
jgi:transposase-like protein